MQCSSQSVALCGKVADKSGSLWERTAWDSGGFLDELLFLVFPQYETHAPQSQAIIWNYLFLFPLHIPNKKTPHAHQQYRTLLFRSSSISNNPYLTSTKSHWDFPDVLALLFLSSMPRMYSTVRLTAKTKIRITFIAIEIFCHCNAYLGF